MVQLSHLYMTIGKIIALTIRTFVNEVMSLLFNTLSRFVIAFLPRSIIKKRCCQVISDIWKKEILGTNLSRCVFHMGLKNGCSGGAGRRGVQREKSVHLSVPVSSLLSVLSVTAIPVP